MTNPVQDVQGTWFTGGATSANATFASLPSAGNSVIVATYNYYGGATASISSVTDNQTGAPNTYVKILSIEDTNYNDVALEFWWCSSVTVNAGTFTVTANCSSGANGMLVRLVEASSLTAVDQYQTLVSGTSATSLTITNPAANATSSNFVLALIGFEYSGPSQGLTYPATTGYTDIGYTNGWSNYIVSELSAKTETSTVTSAASWTWTSANLAVAALVSFKAGGGGSASGSGAITESSDVAAGSGGASASGSGATTEAHDTLSGAGASSTSGSGAAVESSDAVSGAGATSTSGSGAAVESADVVAGAGAASTSGSAAILEAADLVAGVGAGSSSAGGSGALAESADQVSGAGATSAAGSGAVSENPDTVSASGAAVSSGSGAVSESADIVSGAGSAAAVGSGAVSEGADQVAGSAGASTSGAGAIAESTDTVSAAGSAGTAGVGSGAMNESPDAASGAGVDQGQPPTSSQNPGSVPGFVPDGDRGPRGPIRRPGQVFGERDPVSPFTTSKGDGASRANEPVFLSPATPRYDARAPTPIAGETASLIAGLSPHEMAAVALALDDLLGPW